ncbi:MAG: GDP-mannose 4,6-dehydratase [Paludibacter sp.]|nr:GDP-mannose 4,6-dehydratase [Paludibacter sp.]
MKNLLFTGANGFVGKNVIALLKNDFEITTLDISNAEIIVNLANEIPVFNKKIDIVFHAAGKAHVNPKTEAEKQSFYDINYCGTVNLCRAFEVHGNFPKVFIFLSTVAVYGCVFGENITENHALNGTTSYALSKIQAEKFLRQWANKHNVILAIIRPSLLAGKNPTGNLGEMICGIQKGRYLRIGDGKVRKSVLMVQDLAKLIPLLAQAGGTYNVCSDEQPSFNELERLIIKQLHKSKVWEMPMCVAKFCAKVGDFLHINIFNSDKLIKITSNLTFSNEKAKRELGWQPMNILENFKIN